MQKLVLIVLLACLTSACQLQLLPQESGGPASTQAPLTPMTIIDRDHVPRIELADAKQHFDVGTAYFVDARSRSEYEEQHIAGAYYLLHWAARASLGSAQRQADHHLLHLRQRGPSASLAFRLYQNGYPQVAALHGGLRFWVAAEYPMTSGAER
ncbi:MAG: rhodanese-like domain-containing protein [Caldilineaceae bacterium]